MDRAEKAERERDEWKDSAIKAMADLERAEQPRPLTADDITDEMRIRAWRAMREWENREWSLTHEQAGDMVLRAALTPPPTRPEGAERWEMWLSRLDYLHDETGASRADLATLADDLATEVGLTPTNPEEQQ